MTQLFGHDMQIEAILAAARSGRMHHGWLLVGPEGVGKASFAHAVAQRLLAEATEAPLGGTGVSVPEEHPTARLIAAGSHPDLIVMERISQDGGASRARSIVVDQARQLNARFATTPSQSSRRIVIIDAADDLERPAANAILKNLEEPPKDTIFLLINHVPGRLLPTIRSRCTKLKFSGLSDEAMTSVLRAQVPEMAVEERDTLIAMAGGSPGRALAVAGLGLAEIEEQLSLLAREGDPTNRLRSAMAQKLALKSAQPRYEAFLARVPAFIAERAKQKSGAELGNALSSWESARGLAQSAVSSSLDPQMTVFALAGHVAALAPARGAAKA